MSWPHFLALPQSLKWSPRSQLIIKILTCLLSQEVCLKVLLSLRHVLHQQSSEKKQKEALPGVCMWKNMWKNMWKMCYFHVCFTCFSPPFHMHFTSIFHMSVKFCIVKQVWKACEVMSTLSHIFHIHFHSIFTCSFTLICNKISHATLHKISL